MSQAESINIDLPRLMSIQPLETANAFVGQSKSYGLLGIYGEHFVGQTLADGRGMNEGKAYTRSDKLVYSTSQNRC